jgi:hypothetical protein
LMSSLVVKYRSSWVISKCRSMYEEDQAISVAFKFSEIDGIPP